MRKLLPVFLLFCACRETTVAWDQPVNNNDGCKQFDTSTQAIGATEPSPDGFTALEVQAVLEELPSKLSGTWSQYYIDGDLKQPVQVSYSVDPSKAELVERPAGQGFSLYTSDGGCPEGPLVRMPAIINLSYSYKDTPIEWTFDTTVEAQAAHLKRIWIWSTRDEPSGSYSEGVVAMLDDLHGQNQDMTPQPPVPEELEGLWVSIDGTPVRGHHQIKAHWTTSLALVVATFDRPNEQ